MTKETKDKIDTPKTMTRVKVIDNSKIEDIRKEEREKRAHGETIARN